MHLLDLTFPTPAENLAGDEALLDFFEEHGGEGVLRFWEPQNYFAVVGYGNHVEKEVNVAACEAEGIPILRRCSGGGTVLQGPGCLNYSLVLKVEEGGELASITGANRIIMERTRGALQSEMGVRSSKFGGGRSKIGVEVRGCTDLTTNHLKFSGNAQRRKKHFLLFHGTFLLNFDIALISKFLRMPSKEPDYQEGRSHQDFLTNLNLTAEAVKSSMREAWGANQNLPAGRWRSQVELLVRDKYVTKEWNLKF